MKKVIMSGLLASLWMMVAILNGVNASRLQDADVSTKILSMVGIFFLSVLAVARIVETAVYAIEHMQEEKSKNSAKEEG